MHSSMYTAFAIFIIFASLGSAVCDVSHMDPLWGYFAQVAGQDGQIDAEELQSSLTTSGITGSYHESCFWTFDLTGDWQRDSSRFMGFSEFKEMWSALNQWKNTFGLYDTDRSGTVEPHELHHALVDWGYNLSPETVQIIVGRFAMGNGRMAFDDFIHCALRLRTATEHFRRRDVTQTGHATFTYEDFVQVVMFL